MLISRGVNLLRRIIAKPPVRKIPQNVVPARFSHGEWFYREVPMPFKADVIAAEFLGGCMWWWILWHLWHDFGHVVGEFDYPDPTKWTDEELGIPPED